MVRPTQDNSKDLSTREEPYTVNTVVLSNSVSITNRSFKDFAQAGHTVSIAIDEKNDLVAYLNHTTGRSGCLTLGGTPASEWFSFLFFTALVCGLVFAVAYKMWYSERYQSGAYIAVGVGLALAAVMTWGLMLRPITESKRALAKLQSKK